MRTFLQDISRLNVLLLFFISTAHGFAQDAETLEQRIKGGDVSAIKEAADHGRRELIPALEERANASVDPDEPVCTWAKASLAKLGVKKYLDETIAELTTTNSALFTAYKEQNRMLFGSESVKTRLAKLKAQEKALEKLVYIRNPSTIKFIAPLLYDKENLNREFPSHVLYGTPASDAIRALRQMVDNPPDAGSNWTDEKWDELLKIWQQWWEKNKDRYP
jgi:hypothetical protein